MTTQINRAMTTQMTNDEFFKYLKDHSKKSDTMSVHTAGFFALVSKSLEEKITNTFKANVEKFLKTFQFLYKEENLILKQHHLYSLIEVLVLVFSGKINLTRNRPEIEFIVTKFIVKVNQLILRCFIIDELLKQVEHFGLDTKFTTTRNQFHAELVKKHIFINTFIREDSVDRDILNDIEFIIKKFDKSCFHYQQIFIYIINSVIIPGIRQHNQLMINSVINEIINKKRPIAVNKDMEYFLEFIIEYMREGNFDGYKMFLPGQAKQIEHFFSQILCLFKWNVMMLLTGSLSKKYDLYKLEFVLDTMMINVPYKEFIEREKGIVKERENKTLFSSIVKYFTGFTKELIIYTYDNGITRANSCLQSLRSKDVENIKI